MNTLQRVLIEKAGHDHGFEHVDSSTEDVVVLASARHRSQVAVKAVDGAFRVSVTAATPALWHELMRNGQTCVKGDDVFCVPSLEELAHLLRRVAQLSQALPMQPVDDYHAAVANAVRALPAEERGTEVERLVRQRIGQARYRDALLAYWGEGCAVTGVTVPQALRASHAKPWAECADDAERLDVFNGFLLVANLDALFDQFLVSFDDAGMLLISTRLPQGELHRLGIHPGMSLRWLASEHRPYIQWHRERFLRDDVVGKGTVNSLPWTEPIADIHL